MRPVASVSTQRALLALRSGAVRRLAGLDMIHRIGSQAGGRLIAFQVDQPELLVAAMFIANAVPGFIQARPDLGCLLIFRVWLVIRALPGTLSYDSPAIGSPAKLADRLFEEADLAGLAAIERQNVYLQRSRALAQKSDLASIGRPARPRRVQVIGGQLARRLKLAAGACHRRS